MRLIATFHDGTKVYARPTPTDNADDDVEREPTGECWHCYADVPSKALWCNSTCRMREARARNR